jgi:hypothetical protein
MNYLETPALRTMNETTAAIAGDEIGLAFIERYYPELAPPPEEDSGGEAPQEPPRRDPQAFDINYELRQTRLVVDDLLEMGKVEAAEAYMEARRKYFWEHGYQIRKLNQAYFAFYGAYADEPGGAAGEDPVGAAVRSMRAASPRLVDFVNQMAWLTGFEQLQELVGSVDS